jgi:hypothetical protein
MHRRIISKSAVRVWADRNRVSQIALSQQTDVKQGN